MAKKERDINFTVVELFAGVGGFRLGLKKSEWETIWANQWEPEKKEQHAFKCYVDHFGEKNSVNEDIGEVKDDIPKHDLLVGGFPCQDYSVATANAHGLHGKKGVLWWDIEYILEKRRPPFILLENVDRLLKSPAKQRGRDFGIILACLNRLGYCVEWRVINAADYGFPQRRRRTFIFATRNQQVKKALYSKKKLASIIAKNGFFAKDFPVTLDAPHDQPPLSFKKKKSNKAILALSNDLDYHFHNAGVMINGDVFTNKVLPIKEDQMNLMDKLEKNVDEAYYISNKDIKGPKGWKYCKGAKNEKRIKKDGYKYRYTEGAIPFPDKLDRPSRTMLTGEGNKRPNRIAHVIKDPGTGHFRILTPVEAEKLNGFPKGWTEGMPQRWRYFCMGNALVVGLIERMGKRLRTIIENPPDQEARAESQVFIRIDGKRKRARVLQNVKS